MAACDEGPLRVYGSAETHTWIHKAADLFGLGTDAIRWIDTDDDQRMLMPALREAIAEDQAAGAIPLLVVGAAGSVSTGAIDPLDEIAAVCREEGIWFHVDGAYGAPAAVLPEAPPQLKALALADSVAIDPHKWLYAPLEAGCALVRDPQALLDAFTYRPPLLRVPRGGGRTDQLHRLRATELARVPGAEGLARAATGRPRGLRPHDLRRHRARQAAPSPGVRRSGAGGVDDEPEHHDLPLRARGRRAGRPRDRGVPQHSSTARSATGSSDGGETYVSNAVVGDTYLLRACVVNFRTSADDIAALPEIVKRVGAEAHADQNPLRAA